MAQFPKVSGSNLEGRKFQLPRDFEGAINLAIVPFQRWHQDVVDTWAPALGGLVQAMPGFRFYELPTLWRMNPLYRWGIDAGMRAGIPDRSTREITITLYLDKDAFRRQLEIPNEETIHLLLVTPQGEINWRTTGEASPEKLASLTAHLQAWQSASAVPNLSPQTTLV